MATTKFMGAGQLIDRLTAQTGSREAAVALLRARGHMNPHDEKLTPAGEARNAMTAQERAIDRAKTGTNKPASAFKYDPKTNRATLRRFPKG